MYIWKFFKSTSFRRPVLVLLMALLLVSGLVFTQAPDSALGLRREDPTDTDPIGVGDDPPPYHPPAGGFSWSMAKRFGLDSNGDGMIDYHWNKSTMTYDSSYVHPAAWKVTFDGCQTAGDHADPYNPQYEYVWLLDGQVVHPLINTCLWFNNFTDKNPHTVRLSVTDTNGNTTTFADQTVRIKDYLIVSIGDSLASGEGNPDIPQVVDPGFMGIGWVQIEPAKWQDERCDRSAFSSHALAALALEASDPHSSVTFISFACSGASINLLRYDDEDLYKMSGAGLLRPFRGTNTNIPYNSDYVGYIPAQMEQLQTALVPPNNQDPREIDALLISAGGNDIHFGKMAEVCMWNLDCWNNPTVLVHEDPTERQGWPLYDLVNRALKLGDHGWPARNLPDNFDDLGEAINNLTPKPKNVYITQYPEYTIGNINNGEHCRMLDDIAWPNPYFAIASNEAAVASHFVTKKLDDAISDAVSRFKTTYTTINWQLVDGLYEYVVDDQKPAGTPGLFAGPVNGQGHGYCADDNWIRRADESELLQGPVNFRSQTKGTMHPSFSGQEAIKSRILYYMLPDIVTSLPEEPPQQEPPAFSFSYSSNGLTSQPGLNGWYIRSCESNGLCYPKVVGQALAVSNATLNGASISVNDQEGCPIGSGVICDLDLSADLKQVTYSLEISASGTYRLQFNVQDSSGQVSFLQQEIKVDLEDPVLATPFGPFQVAEGGSVDLSASVATDVDGIPLNGDVLVDYDWNLDGDTIFETTDEHPAFSAAELDGPMSQFIKVKVIDRAGRTATAQTTVNVSNVAPVVAINGAPSTSPEGTAISLTSTVTDPGADDTFNYVWTVKKDGTAYVSGSGSNLSFTPDDNGSYEVSLSVADDDDGLGTASQTIIVTNASPALSNLTLPPTSVNEAASFTLSGEITDPGTADTFTLTINWGDGSAPEGISLPAGSTGFSRSHTYADDDPTGTASDPYSIAVSISDDDGGTGSASASLIVDNLAPSVTISAPENGSLYAVNATVNLSASLTDPSVLDTLTCSINWDDGTSETGTLAAGVCTASHVYTAAGVYTIQLTGTDDDTGAKTESVMAVVYDPSEGFVTGGGWIDSPMGAYIPDPSLAGRAGFGFVSKYQKGATIPSGRTQFQFQAGSFYFESEAYDWLVVAGARAQFKGTGAVNGLSGYGFLLTLTDGQINGGGGVDKFRIKIWDASGVVYDNMISYPDDMDGANPQAIGGGSIVIHSK